MSYYTGKIGFTGHLYGNYAGILFTDKSIGLRQLTVAMAKIDIPFGSVMEPEDGKYTCPVCGDYAGERGSVEAHITGKSDDDHQGLVGKDYRAKLDDGSLVLCEEPVNSLDDPGTEEPESEPVDDPEDSPDGSEVIAWLLVIGLFAALALSNLGDDNSDQLPAPDNGPQQ